MTSAKPTKRDRRLEGDPGARPDAHIFEAARALSHEMTGELPRHLAAREVRA